MCRTDREPDGPRTCSKDKRDQYGATSAAIASLAREDQHNMDSLTPSEVPTDDDTYTALMTHADSLAAEGDAASAWGGDGSGSRKAPALVAVASTLNSSGRAAAIAEARKGIRRAEDDATSCEWGGDSGGAARCRQRADGYRIALSRLEGTYQEPTAPPKYVPQPPPPPPQMSDTPHVAREVEAKSAAALSKSQSALAAGASEGHRPERLSMLLGRVSEDSGRLDAIAPFVKIDEGHAASGDVARRNAAVEREFDRQVSVLANDAATQWKRGEVEDRVAVGKLKALRSVVREYNITDPDRLTRLTKVATSYRHADLLLPRRR